MPANEGAYSAAWTRYCCWSLAFWLLFVLYLPGLASLSHALGWTRGDGSPVLVAALVWMIAFAVVGYVKWNFRCPRCRELFFRKFDDRPWRRDWRRDPFARHCMYRGLAKWAAA